MDAPQPIETQVLLAHVAWVQRLAHTLVADPNTADDLAQETWLTALERPPSDASNPRGWLATVLFNAKRERRRGDERRRLRERSVSRVEAEPATLDVIARASQHKELVEIVMALHEPFRTAVLLRFFDDLPPREIAKTLGVSVHTVNSRLQRGLTELRQRLDARRGGERQAWIAALLPLALQAAPHQASAMSPALGALIMNAKWKIAIVVALALIGVLGTQVELDDDRVPEVARSTIVEPPREREREELRAATALSVEESANPRTTAAPKREVSALPVEPIPTARLRGRVLDVESLPITGLCIVFHSTGPEGDRVDSRPTAVSNARGEFEMEAPASPGELVVDQDRYTTVMAGLYRPQASIEPVVVAAGVRSLGGRVYDDAGTPLAGARVSFELDPAFPTRFSHVLDATSPRHWSMETDAHGVFELGGAPIIEGARVFTSLQGFRDDVRFAPLFADRAMDIVLTRPRQDPERLTGDVRASDGRAVPGAHVAFGSKTIITDASGGFSFDLAHDAGERIVAVHPGFAPAELRAEPAAPHWPTFVRLVLGATPLSLAGRVVDARGDAVRGARVWLADPTFFGEVDGVPTHVEHLLAKRRATRDDDTRAASEPTGGPDLLWSWFRTDADGRFRVDGLCNATYRLQVLEPRTLVRVEAGPFESGREDLKIVLPADAEYEVVSGRVLARDGAPVAGIKVGAVRRVVRVTSGMHSSSYGHGGALTTTDAEGRFSLERVARDDVFLAVAGDPILSTWLDLPGTHAPDAKSLAGLEIHVTRRCHLQVELSNASDRANDQAVERADEFSVLDASGVRMSLSLIRGDDDITDEKATLIQGRSPVMALGEDAATLVLLLHGLEVERIPIAIAPGRLNIVRP